MPAKGTLDQMPPMMSVIDIRVKDSKNSAYPRSRKRKWHSKVASGCLKCKQRRIKCDESKGGCTRCQKLGVSCPGYKLPVMRLFEPELDPGFTFESAADRASFEYFVHQGGRVLTTFQLSAIDFWTRLSPQLAMQHPAVRHGLTALGAVQGPLHHVTLPTTTELDVGRELQPQSQSPRRPQMTPLAMQHMSRAIHIISAADPDKLPVEVSLACCIIFLAIQIWIEKSTSANMHILAAYRILRENIGPEALSLGPPQNADHNLQLPTPPPNSPTRAGISNEFLSSFVPFLAPLIAHACAFSDGFPPPCSGIPPDYLLDPGVEEIAGLADGMAAIGAVDRLLKCVLRATSGIRISRAVETQITLAIDLLEARLRLLAGKPSGGIDHLLLRVHHRVASIMFPTLGRTDEHGFDDFHADFAFIVKSSRRILHVRDGTTKSSQSSDPLVTTLGIIAPLFFAATRCRDPRLRHEALDILHRTEVGERGWTSCMAALIARFVIHQEENVVNPSGDAPSGALIRRRIRLQSVESASASKMAIITYSIFEGPDAASTKVESPIGSGPGEESEGSCVESYHTATIPYPSHPLVEVDGVTCPMPRKVLRACGYTSIFLFTPRVKCYCGWRSELPPPTVQQIS